jgi:hypothetical protein
MITKNKSQKIKQLKYLLMLPLIGGMLLYVSCSDDTQANVEQIENVLKEENIPSEGKYFRADNGFIIFMGTHLEGTIVPLEEYTDKEKEVFSKIEERGNETIEMSIVIDTNGDRVYFMKTNYFNKTDDSTVIDDGSIPFSIIENVPVFPGCEGTEEELKACFQENITNHVAKNFNSALAKNLGLKSGVKRIFVMFKIDKEGNIVEVMARAPHKSLQEEAIRVVQSLPKMEPGKQQGAAVGVKYSLPIAFKVGDNNESKDTSSNEEQTPIYILDGKEISKEEMEKIKPNPNLSINVMNKNIAIKKYGKKGENGVVEITTK